MNRSANVLQTMLNIERQVARVLSTTMDITDNAGPCQAGSVEQREQFYQQRQILQLTLTQLEDMLERMRQMIRDAPRIWIGDTALAWSKSMDSVRQAKALVVSSYVDCP